MVASAFADVTTNGIDVTQIFQYGVLGLILLLILLGKLVPGYMYERREEELKALQNKLDRLETIIEERVIPALVRSTDVLAKSQGQNGPYGDTFR